MCVLLCLFTVDITIVHILRRLLFVMMLLLSECLSCGLLHMLLHELLLVELAGTSSCRFID